MGIFWFFFFIVAGHLKQTWDLFDPHCSTVLISTRGNTICTGTKSSPCLTLDSQRAGLQLINGLNHQTKLLKSVTQPRHHLLTHKISGWRSRVFWGNEKRIIRSRHTLYPTAAAIWCSSPCWTASTSRRCTASDTEPRTCWQKEIRFTCNECYQTCECIFVWDLTLWTHMKWCISPSGWARYR